MMQQMMSAMPELRYQPTLKHVRVRRGGTLVADTKRPVLIWEPTRVVPSYAVPEADMSATLEPAPTGPAPEYQPLSLGEYGPAILDPSIPFAVHTSDGEPLTVRVEDAVCEGAAYRLADPDLRRICRPWTSTPSTGGRRTSRSSAILATRSTGSMSAAAPARSASSIKVRFWPSRATRRCCSRVPFQWLATTCRRSDVRVELRPGTLETACAYKGHATHYSVDVGGEELSNIAWSYEEPLDDALQVKSLVCFYQERLDLFVDGETVERVQTPWSDRES